MAVDIDRYLQRNDPTWRRLEELTKDGPRGARRFSDAEVTELIALYQRVSAQLSHARTQYGDPALNARLSQLLGAARNIIYQQRRGGVRSVGLFFSETFPAAVWGSRRFIAAAMICLLLPAIGMGIWLANNPAALDASIPPEAQELYASHEFKDYYSSEAARSFSGRVMINNIQVAFLAFALGVVVLIGPAYILATNGMNIGVMAAVMHQAGESSQFWGLILPHGLLEIASILVAGAAGLRLSWAVVAPGDKTRARAFADEAMRSVVIVMGLAICFIVAGLIEGFVTPSSLPTSMRIAIGVGVFSFFVVYIVAFGSNAERKGLTGLFGEERQI